MDELERGPLAPLEDPSLTIDYSSKTLSFWVRANGKAVIRVLARAGVIGLAVVAAYAVWQALN